MALYSDAERIGLSFRRTREHGVKIIGNKGTKVKMTIDNTYECISLQIFNTCSS